MDPDTRRRLLILQHGRDARAQKTVDPPIFLRPTAELVEADERSHGGWLVMEDEKSSLQLHRQVPGLALETNSLESGRQQGQAASVSHAMDASISSEKPQISQVKLGEVCSQWMSLPLVSYWIHRYLSTINLFYDLAIPLISRDSLGKTCYSKIMSGQTILPSQVFGVSS